MSKCEFSKQCPYTHEQVMKGQCHSQEGKSFDEVIADCSQRLSELIMKQPSRAEGIRAGGQVDPLIY